jgi:hypothetical protein
LGVLVRGNGVRHVTITLDDLLIRIPFGWMSVLVPTHEVREISLALSSAKELIQKSHVVFLPPCGRYSPERRHAGPGPNAC